jgi:hypothetical protein
MHDSVQPCTSTCMLATSSGISMQASVGRSLVGATTQAAHPSLLSCCTAGLRGERLPGAHRAVPQPGQRPHHRAHHHAPHCTDHRGVPGLRVRLPRAGHSHRHELVRRCAARGVRCPRGGTRSPWLPRCVQQQTTGSQQHLCEKSPAYGSAAHRNGRSMAGGVRAGCCGTAQLA